MEKALYGSVTGKSVTASEFLDLATPDYKKRNIFPYCAACHEIVHPYGVHTPNQNTPKRFDHPDRLPDADPLDDCILANRNARYRGLEPDGWDDMRGALMRREFFREDNLAVAFAFCLSLCRKGNLPATKFRSMIRRADRKRVWAYVGIPLWAFPYVLLTLENFTGHGKDGNEYEFHFSFKKPSDSNISALWTRSQDCRIVKLFTSGETIVTTDNPFPVSEKAMLEKIGNTNWIRPEFLQTLRV